MHATREGIGKNKIVKPTKPAFRIQNYFENITELFFV